MPRHSTRTTRAHIGPWRRRSRTCAASRPGKVLGTPDGSPAPFYFLAELSFDDMDALQAALASEEGQAAAADVATFASGGATLMLAET